MGSGVILSRRGVLGCLVQDILQRAALHRPAAFLDSNPAKRGSKSPDWRARAAWNRLMHSRPREFGTCRRGRGQRRRASPWPKRLSTTACNWFRPSTRWPASSPCRGSGRARDHRPARVRSASTRASGPTRALGRRDCRCTTTRSAEACSWGRPCGWPAASRLVILHDWEIGGNGNSPGGGSDAEHA